MGEQFAAMLPIVETTVMPKIADKIFPGLMKAHPKAKQVDMRCDFNKKELSKNMTTSKASEIRFVEGGRIEYDISTSCGIFSSSTILGGNFKWRPFKTVYMHVQGFTTIDLKNFPQFNKLGLKINEAKADIIEMKVIDDGKQIEEDGSWRKAI